MATLVVETFPLATQHISLRRLVGLFLIGVCALGAVSCAPGKEDQKTDKLKVAVTILPQAEFAEKVGGDRVETMVMIPPGAEPHAYEPTPRQLVELSSAALYIQVGSGLAFERIWMDKIRDINREMPIVDSAAGIERIGGDPHIWLAPRRARAMVANICAGLTRVDPDSRAYYERNRDLYLRELDELDARIRSTLEQGSVSAFMVYHPSWGYFARDYGLEQLAVEEEGKEPTAQSLARLVRQARERGLTVLFVEPQFDSRSARTIAVEIGARIVSIDPLPGDYVAELNRFADHLSSR